jgi:hypothetical protein
MSETQSILECLTVSQVTDLIILLFELLANLIGRHRPAEWLAHFT